MMWILKACTLIIDVSQLTNAMKWLLILVCLLILTRIDQILTTWILATYHFVYINDWVECENIKDINGLVKIWMPKYLLQVECDYNQEIYSIAIKEMRYINL
jgi:hypothetical protein